jgi:stalled ribosome rescue protein Dom34
MPKNIGLWIDHRKAVLVTLEGKAEAIRLIQSEVEQQTRSRGGAHMKTTHTAQYFPAEDHLDRQVIEKLNKYYETVITALRGADSVLVLGPGEAKSELEKRIACERAVVRIVAVETADKMTNRQIADHVRRYYQKRR